jgi:hypothetical protein
MKSTTLLVLAMFASTAILKAQAYPEVVHSILTKQLQSPQVVTYQLQEFL